MSEQHCQHGDHQESPSGVKTVPSCHAHQDKPDWLLRACLVLTVLLYGAHWLRGDTGFGMEWLMTLSHSVFEIMNTIWWGIVLGFLMIALLGQIPREFVMSALGTRPGILGIWRAVIAGVLLDLCSHGILMVGAKLYERGASAGQVMAFLVSSPWNSLSLTLILIAMIGLPWTLGFIGLSMIIALITGMIFEILVNKSVLSKNPNRADLPQDFRFWEQARRQWQSASFTRSFWMAALRSAISESRMVVRWILFGVLLASAVRAFIAPEQFQTLFGPSLAGLAITIGVATILEVCSEGSTPIAADILNRAGAPGNSFAFLMGGVATDYTEILVLKEATGSLKTALFLPLVTVPQVLLLAWVINQATV